MLTAQEARKIANDLNEDYIIVIEMGCVRI